MKSTVNDLDKSTGGRDDVVEKPPSMCITPTSNLLEDIGSIPY